MKAWRPWLSHFLQSRRILRGIDRIAAGIERQNEILARIADQVAPQVPTTTQADLKDTITTYSRDAEMAKIEAYVQRVYQDTGREPTEDEILDYLDGKPQ